MSARETARGRILVRRAAKDGEQGIPGLIYRTSRWESGKEYRNDTDLTSTSDGFRYVDVVTDVDMALVGTDTFNAYICKKTHNSSDSIPLTEGTYWTKMNSLKPIATSLILASKILAKYINVENLAADTAFLTALTTESAFINKLIANTAFLQDLAASSAFIEALSVKHLNAADGIFKGSFEAEAEWIDEYDENYKNTIILNPQRLVMEGKSTDGSQYEYVDIAPLFDPDRYDKNALMDIKVNNSNKYALSIHKGLCQGTRQNVTVVTSSTTINAFWSPYVIVRTAADITLTLDGADKGTHLKILNVCGSAITLKASTGVMYVRYEISSGYGLVGSAGYSSDVREFDCIHDGTYWNVIPKI